MRQVVQRGAQPRRQVWRNAVAIVATMPRPLCRVTGRQHEYAAGRHVVSDRHGLLEISLDEKLPEIETNASRTSFAAYLSDDRSKTLREMPD